MHMSDWSSDVCSSDLPYDSEFERLVLGELVELRRTLDRAGWDLSIEKPLFDTLTPTGACRPDFILEACARQTGEIRRIAVDRKSVVNGKRGSVSVELGGRRVPTNNYHIVCTRLQY